MPSTPDQVQALRDEIQAWIERNKLVCDATWWTADEYFGGKLISNDYQHYLVLSFEGDLNDVMWRQSLRKQGRVDKLKDEFDAILERHRFWYDFNGNDTIYIYSRDELFSI